MHIRQQHALQELMLQEQLPAWLVIPDHTLRPLEPLLVQLVQLGPIQLVQGL